MSFAFSKVIITTNYPQGKPFVRYEGGFLDEFDVYDKMKRDPDYSEISFAGDVWEQVRIEHYRFYSNEAKERPADGDHFAMMRAYDELAAQCGAEPFMDRNEIQYVGFISCSVSRICEQIRQRPI